MNIAPDFPVYGASIFRGEVSFTLHPERLECKAISGQDKDLLRILGING